MIQERNNIIDITKGIGIFFVIWGHTVCPVKPYLYIFHVPLFFLLSGYFFNKSNSISVTFFKKSKSLIVPFFFFLFFLRLGFIVIHLIDGKFTADLLFPWKPMYPGITIGPLWFILSLFVATMLFSILSSLVRSDIIQFLVCFLLTWLGYILFNLRIHLPLHIDSSLSMMLFFFIGTFLNKKNILRKSINFLQSFGFSLSLLAIFFLYTELYLPEIDVSVNKLHGVFLITIVLMILGCFMILALSDLLNRVPVVRSYLAYIGQNSLTVFAIHIAFVISVYLLFPNNSISTVGGLIIVLYSLIMSLILDFLLRKYTSFVFGDFKKIRTKFNKLI